MTNQEFTQHITESADFSSLVARPLPEFDMFISVYWGTDHNKKNILLGVNFHMGINVAPNDPNLTTFFDYMQDTLLADEKLTKYVNLWHVGKGQPSIESVAHACVSYPQFEELFNTPTESTSEPIEYSNVDRIEWYAGLHHFVAENDYWEEAKKTIEDDDCYTTYNMHESIDAIQDILNQELDGDGRAIVSESTDRQKHKDGTPIEVRWIS